MTLGRTKATAILTTALLLAGARPAVPASGPSCNGRSPTIRGTSGQDVLRGTSRADVIVGFGGNDTIYGSGGNDVICGGYGNDRVFGGSGNDRIFGQDGNDALTGDGGDDLISGGGGADSARGNDGADVMYGGAGPDRLYGHAGPDRLSGGDGDDLLSGGIDEDVLSGGPGRDSLLGGSGNDRLDGGTGDDSLSGGDGDDALAGGGGNDTLVQDDPAAPAAPSPTTSPDVGPRNQPCPAGAVDVRGSIQAAIDAHGTGTTFCIKAGVHRVTSRLTPKSGQRFVGEPGAVVSGARLLTSWTVDGSAWRASTPMNQSAGASPSGGTVCDGGYLCNYNEDVTYDDAFLRRVGSKAEVVRGTYYIDYGADLIYLGDNPVGHEVEVAVATGAFGGGSPNVQIRNLTIEKFANAGQSSAVSVGPGGVFESGEVRLVHGIGICTWAGTGTVRGSFIHHNGEMGVCGQNNGNLFEGNEISYNAPQAVGFNVFWEGGGSKFATSNTNLVLRGNFVHHNRGAGLWTDWNNSGILVEGNRTEDNTDAGILIEVSCNVVIRNNVVRGNGWSRAGNGSYWGGGIVNWQSSGVEVYGNTLEGNRQGIMAIETPRGTTSRCGVAEVRNFYVHDNTVRQSIGHVGGLALYNSSNTAVFSSRGNRWASNRYCVPSTSGRWFWWQPGEVDWSAWRGYGHDAGGTLGVGC